MTDLIHGLVERYGLIAVFVGCLAEGESAAILAGFFAHQHVFGLWQAFAATFLGAFGGDALFFLAGRRFGGNPRIAKIQERPGFARARQLVREHPAPYVLINRYVYGFRMVGGVAAGLSGMPTGQFLLLNAVSAIVWSLLFCGIGYLFGLGAEQLVGGELKKHQRLLIALGVGLAMTLAAWFLAHTLSRRGRKQDQ